MLGYTLHHTDWNSEAAAHVELDIIYIVVKKGLLANAFGLFQAGREASSTGLIVEWDEEENTWIDKV